MNRRGLLIGGGLLAVAAGATYVVKSGMGSMSAYAERMAEIRAALQARPGMLDFIRLATLAPSGHNTQPWRFRVDGERIDILPDFSRRTPVVDPDDHHLFVGLGAAAETLALAAGSAGQPAEVAFVATGDGAMSLRFGKGAAAQDDALVAAITKRRSTRALFDGRPVAAGDLALLRRAGEAPGVDLILLTDRPMIARARDLVVAGNTTQLADPEFLGELKQWLRFNPNQAIVAGDGLFSAASGLPVLPTWLGPSAFDWFLDATSENDKYASQIDSSAGIAVFVGAKADADHWTRVGRACQRLALRATALGLKCAFVNQPVEVPGLRADLASLIGLPGRRPDLVLRFGYGPDLPYAARRPVSAVMA